jgi:hypothetical protein
LAGRNVVVLVLTQNMERRIRIMLTMRLLRSKVLGSWQDGVEPEEEAEWAVSSHHKHQPGGRRTQMRTTSSIRSRSMAAKEHETE